MAYDTSQKGNGIMVNALNNANMYNYQSQNFQRNPINFDAKLTNNLIMASQLNAPAEKESRSTIKIALGIIGLAFAAGSAYYLHKTGAIKAMNETWQAGGKEESLSNKIIYTAKAARDKLIKDVTKDCKAFAEKGKTKLGIKNPVNAAETAQAGIPAQIPSPVVNIIPPQSPHNCLVIITNKKTTPPAETQANYYTGLAKQFFNYGRECWNNLNKK